jgi:hypothetical protein
VDNFTFGLVKGHQKRADEAHEVSMAGAMGMMQANKRIRELEDKLAIANAEAAGRLAQVEAFQAEHAASPLMQKTSKAFTDPRTRGQLKTKVRMIYENTFDAFLAKLNIANPASLRLD